MLERLAAALNTTVGNLVSGEGDGNALPPLVSAGEIDGPLAATRRVTLEDDAMETPFYALRAFGVGDEVEVAPRRPMPGDIALVMHAGRPTLRECFETEAGISYRPRKGHYAILTDAQVLGVVTGATLRRSRP